jgi:hypothetical protein
MITKQEAQNCIAYLELARTAIDMAEARIVGATDRMRPGLQLCKAAGEIAAAACNLTGCAEEIRKIACDMMEKLDNAAASKRVPAG